MKIVAVLLLALMPAAAAGPPKISAAEYRRKVMGSWLGQMVGNIYGLPHENKYIDQPGEDTFPYGYLEKKRMAAANGAFSDDDTDFEYLYLLAMEKYGPEPTYAQLAGLWKHHVRDKVWLANRAALGLMHYGYRPPLTGVRSLNPHWFQIDPQLINEIWAVTAPGMVRYAAEKSAWAARITDDSWGIEPTVHYGAMYAAAFFESDVNRLIDIGTRALPAGSRFAATVEAMKALHRKHPNDWKAARAEMARLYYVNEPAESKTIWNANLNGAAGILALLYGQGDFQKTLDLACAIGFDADNQAATMAGLIGLIKGVEGIPAELLFPFKDRDWLKPFNDTYKNVSRYDMPDASISDQVERMAQQGEKIILSHGGKKVNEGGQTVYLINADARFSAPLEIAVPPVLVLAAGRPLHYGVTTTGAGPGLKWAASGLPGGLSLRDGVITGTPTAPGMTNVKISAGSASAETLILVHGPNLAAQAAEVLAAVPRVDPERLAKFRTTVARSLFTPSVEVIRDGKLEGDGSVFYSLGAAEGDREDFYGYRWTEPVEAGVVVLHTGSLEASGGWWLKVPDVEYLDATGQWRAVTAQRHLPAMAEGAEPYDKPHFVEYVFAFDRVKTRGLRLRGTARNFTSITELSVFSPIPNR